jgi:preprotein translocase subunit SecF
MKKLTLKKYPLLISLIVSCVIVVVSLFILGFCGMKTGTSLAGGTQFEVTISTDADTKTYVSDIKTIVRQNGLDVDSAFVEDKYVSAEENTEYTSRVIVVKIAEKNISDDAKSKISEAIATKLGISSSNISEFYEITSSVTSRNILFIGLGVGIVAICLFVFAWLRYNIFAGLSFLLAYLHNIILYISILIITRVQISLVSLSVGLILTLIMGAVLISIYEKNREKVKLHLSDKLSVSERMIESEKQAVLPYGFIFIGMLVFAALMFFIPVSSVRLSAVNIIIALVVTAYTSLIIGPGSYAALLEIRDLSQKAVLSRNHTINKEIKKKIKKNTTKKV